MSNSKAFLSVVLARSIAALCLAGVLVWAGLDHVLNTQEVEVLAGVAFANLLIFRMFRVSKPRSERCLDR